MGTQVVISFPDLDWVGVVTQLLRTATTALVCAISIGLALWACSFIYRKFKSLSAPQEQLYGVWIDGTVYVSNYEHSVGYLQDEFYSEHGREWTDDERDDAMSHSKFDASKVDGEHVVYGP